MANQNIKVRVSSLNSTAKHFYVKVGYGNGTNGSQFIKIGGASDTTSSSGSQLSSDQFSTSVLDGGYGSYTTMRVYSSSNPVTLSSSTYDSAFDSSYSTGINHPDGNSTPIISINTYFVDIVYPASPGYDWGTWTQKNSSGTTLDTVAPNSGTWSYPNSSSNTELKIVFNKRVGDSSGNLWTASTFPGFSYVGTGDTTAENFGVSAVSYSTTTVANDTVTLTVLYDGSVTNGDEVSFQMNGSDIYNENGIAGSSTVFSGDLSFPTTGTSGRTYFDRTFRINNTASSTFYFFLKVDNGEGTHGSNYVKLGSVAASGTTDFAVSNVLINDGDYDSGYYTLVATSTDQDIPSSDNSSWQPSDQDATQSFYGAKNTSSEPRFTIDNTRSRYDLTSTGTSFTNVRIYDSSGNEVDYTVSNPTITVANSSGTGTIVADFGEKIYKSSAGYGSTPTYSDLTDLTQSDISSVYIDSSTASSASISGLTYQTSDDSGAMAIYGTDSTSNNYGTGWFYPVYLDQEDAGGSGSSHSHTFSEYSGLTVYMPNSGSNHAQSQKPAGYVIYQDQVKISFTYSGSASSGDKISVYMGSSGSNVYDVLLNSLYLSLSELEMQADSAAAPTVSSVAISGATNAQNSLLNTGDVVSVTVTFSSAVTVNTSGGTPSIAIDIGGVSRSAAYSSGSGTTSIVFAYTIASSETTDTDGISIGANAISLNSGTMKDSSNQDATLTHSAVSANSSFKVDTTAPTISSVSLASDNSTATVTFSEDVYTNSNGSGDLTAADFTLSLSGGNASSISLNATASSISKTSQSVWVLTLNGTDLDSNASGNETLVVDSASDTAIYDYAGNAHTAAHGGQSLNSTVASTSKSISSSGGTVSTSGGSISIPSNALSSTQLIGMDVSDTSTVADSTPSVVVNKAYSPVVSLTPHGQDFSEAVTIMMDIIGSSQGSCPSDLKVFKRANPTSSWYEVPSSLWSCSSGTISLSTTKFSQYQAIGGQNMALTRKDARQLRKITVEDKINPRSIDLVGDGTAYTETGSNSSGNHLSFVDSVANSAAIAAGDLFIMADISASGGDDDPKTKKVTAAILQDFFSSVDVTDEASDNNEHRILFVNAGSGDLAGASLEMDSAGMTFNPSSDTLTLGGALVAASLDISGDIDIDGTTNLDAVDIDGAVQADGTITVGASQDGYDVKFFGNGSGKSLLWDESEDSLVITGDAADALKVAGGVDIDGVMEVGANTSGFDVKFFGDADGAYMQWDASVDDLILGGAAGLIVPDGQLSLGSTAVTSTAAELNKLDGASADVTAAKLSTLSALTDAEIGYVDGATSANSVGSKVVVLDSSGNLALPGNLTISGTTTTVDTTNLLVEDKNVELGVVDTPTDTTADGGGITLKGATDKTFNWVSSTNSWTSSEDLDLLTGKHFSINGTTVLAATSLGSGVVSSSLTSVGALAGGSIASGFGNIDNGTSTLSTGAATVASLNASSGGITNAGAIAGASSIDGSGDLSMGSITMTGFSVDGDGDVVAKSLDNSSGGITNAGSIAGASSIDGSGDLTMGTITMTGFSVDADGDMVAKSLDNSSGGITNAGAISGATTIAGSGLAQLGSLQVDTASTIGCDADGDLLTLSAQSVVVAADSSITYKGSAISSSGTELSLLDADVAASSVALASGDALIIGDADASNASKKVLVSDMSAFLAGDGIIQDSSSKKLEIVPVKLVAFGSNDALISAIADGEDGYSDGYRHKISVGSTSSSNFPMKETLQVFVNGQLMTMHATDEAGSPFGSSDFSASEDAADYAYKEPTSSAAGVVRFKDGVIKFVDDVVSIHYLRKV